MIHRLSKATSIAVLLALAQAASAEVFTVGGGKTIRAATKHDYARLELNVDWKPEIWRVGGWVADLKHSTSLAGFWDENSV